MDYKTTYTYHFKTTQSRITSLIQNKLKVNKRLDRSFQLIDEKLETFYIKQLDILKDSLDYNQLKPFINKIGVRSDYYKKHTLSKILSNEIKEDFEKLNNDKPYKKFIAEIAQMKAVEDGFYNYKNNRPYFDLCYKADDIEYIGVERLESGYTGSDHFYELQEKIYPVKSKSFSTKKNNSNSQNTKTLEQLLSVDEKVIIIQVIYNLKVPLNKLLPASEFYRLEYLTSGLFDDRMINHDISNYGIYRKLGKHVDLSEKSTRNTIDNLIKKLEKLKVNTFIPELRKLLTKTN